MKVNSYYLLSFILLLFVFTGCSPARNLVYFSDIKVIAPFEMAIDNAYKPKIQEGDIVAITVSTLDPNSNALFNTGALSNYSNQTTTTVGSVNLGKEGYLVGSDGNINFPVIGKIQLAGLTLEEARNKVQTETVVYVKEPIVNMRFLNFKVTVVGEVNKPGSFNVENDRMNVLEALGAAGDMTGYGKRENVLVIREMNGVRKMARLDLSSSKAFESPFFYLQQNDLVYVEPDGMRERQVSRNPNTIPIILGIMSVATLIISRFVK